MKKPTPDNQGGARAGAGRKSNASKGLGTLKRLYIGFTDAQLAYIQQAATAQQTGSGEVVRAAVEKIMQLDRRKKTVK